ncbi:CgeB family protein [Desulfolutivibrio sp.]|uniref:CgeB family protein n=1 Tax=Desulfolutivibrio sp. TaxID=2773296 RepID=UPI002F967362
MERTPFSAAAVSDPETGRLVDVLLEGAGKRRHLCGRDGESSLVAAVQEAMAAHEGLVFVGFGMGCGPVAALAAGAGLTVVVDRETPILDVTLAASGLAGDARLIIVSDPDPDRAAQAAMSHLPASFGGRVRVVIHPAYVRLNPRYYSEVANRLRARACFRQQVSYPKFAAARPRVLLVQSDYFLVAEIAAALHRLEIPTAFLPLPDLARGQTAFIEALLAAVTAFRPDFLLTVNHLGMDREGRLMDLLSELKLPLASWFVDNPHLILHDFPRQTSPWCTVFTWDQDTVASLTAMGFSNPVFLPLATDPDHFRRPCPTDRPPEPGWSTDVSFVGSSMVRQVREPLARLSDSPELIGDINDLAVHFAQEGHRSVAHFLAEARPDLLAAFQSLPDVRRRLDFELLLTWEATRQYRTRCVTAILPFTPNIVGDRGWKETLPRDPSWRLLPPVDYYRDLPRFYPWSQVNLNCTSMQMKGAINQRVFDIPACGGFVLTDRREQLQLAFFPNETACYDDPSEITTLVRHYLSNPSERRGISAKARKHILAKHTYRHRLETLLDVMRRIYS